MLTVLAAQPAGKKRLFLKGNSFFKRRMNDVRGLPPEFARMPICQADAKFLNDYAAFIADVRQQFPMRHELFDKGCFPYFRKCAQIAAKFFYWQRLCLRDRPWENLKI